jgi:hypothetical protein
MNPAAPVTRKSMARMVTGEGRLCKR